MDLLQIPGANHLHLVIFSFKLAYKSNEAFPVPFTDSPVVNKKEIGSDVHNKVLHILDGIVVIERAIKGHQFFTDSGQHFVFVEVDDLHSINYTTKEKGDLIPPIFS